jgi:hypothetical protein
MKKKLIVWFFLILMQGVYASNQLVKFLQRAKYSLQSIIKNATNSINLFATRYSLPAYNNGLLPQDRLVSGANSNRNLFVDTLLKKEGNNIDATTEKDVVSSGNDILKNGIGFANNKNTIYQQVFDKAAQANRYSYSTQKSDDFHVSGGVSRRRTKDIYQEEARQVLNMSQQGCLKEIRRLQVKIKSELEKNLSSTSRFKLKVYEHNLNLGEAYVLSIGNREEYNNKGAVRGALHCLRLYKEWLKQINTMIDALTDNSTSNDQVRPLRKNIILGAFQQIENGARSMRARALDTVLMSTTDRVVLYERVKKGLRTVEEVCNKVEQQINDIVTMDFSRMTAEQLFNLKLFTKMNKFIQVYFSDDAFKEYTDIESLKAYLQYLAFIYKNFMWLADRLEDYSGNFAYRGRVDFVRMAEAAAHSPFSDPHVEINTLLDFLTLKYTEINPEHKIQLDSWRKSLVYGNKLIDKNSRPSDKSLQAILVAINEVLNAIVLSSENKKIKFM